MLSRRTRTTCHVSTQIHANKKSTWRRRWKTSQSPLYSHLKTQHVVTCCEHLHTSANIAQQETTLLGPTLLRVVASICTGLKESFRAMHWRNAPVTQRITSVSRFHQNQSQHNCRQNQHRRLLQNREPWSRMQTQMWRM